MYKRLEKYIEKMQNMESPVRNESDMVMWIRGRNDGKNGYINVINGRPTSDYICRELFRHQRYISSIQQLIKDSTETVRYEIIRTEFELRCIKQRLHKARHRYRDHRQLSYPDSQHIHLLSEKIALLQSYKEETEKRLLEIQKELHTTEETADILITQARKLLEKKMYAYLNGAKRYLEKKNIENAAYLIQAL